MTYKTLFFVIALVLRIPYGIVYAGDIMPWWISADTNLQDLQIWSFSRGGAPTTWPATIPIWAYWQVLAYLGIPAEFADSAYHAGMQAMAAVGLLCFLERQGYQRLASTLGALYYAYNIQWSINTAIAVEWLRFVFPWMLLATRDYVFDLTNKHVSVFSKYLVRYLLLTCLSVSVLVVNLPQFVVFIAAFSTYLIYLLLDQWSDFTRQNRRLQVIVLLVGLPILANAWLLPVIWVSWIRPVLTGVGPTVSTVVNIQDWAWTHARATIPNILKLTGYWSWSEKYYGDLYVIYEVPVMQLFLLIPSVTAFLVALLSRQRRINALLLVLIILLTLMNGLQAPLRPINELLDRHFGLGYILREPISKLDSLYIFVVAFLVTHALSKTLRSLLEIRLLDVRIYTWTWYRFLFVITLSISVLVPAGITFPYSVDKRQTSMLPGRTVQIPHDWYALRDWVSKHTKKSDIFLILPRTQFYLEPFNWPGYGVDYFPERFLRRYAVQASPQAYVTNNFIENSIKHIQSEITNREMTDTQAVREALEQFHVRYALLRSDITVRGTGSQLVTDSARDEELKIARLNLEAMGWNVAAEFGPAIVMEWQQSYPSMAWTNASENQQAHSETRPVIDDMTIVGLPNKEITAFSGLPFGSSWVVTSDCTFKISLFIGACAIFVNQTVQPELDVIHGTAAWTLPPTVSGAWTLFYPPQALMELGVSITIGLFSLIGFRWIFMSTDHDIDP